MTDANFCCLCASDEGVFLDIFTATDRQLGNRSFLKEFETCLSVKVKQDEALSTKICHRCAIELGQCNEFVEKYNRVYETTLKQRITISKKSCCMCLSTAKNNYIFTLAKDYCSAVDPLQKIYKCFNRQIKRVEAERRSICLLCRYNLDVLFDLKKLASEVDSKLLKIAESKAILSNLPKTETFVVNRKTTINYQSKAEIEPTSNSQSDSDTMARKSSRTKNVSGVKSPVELKLRTCGQCHTSIKGGIDMYRLHSTGITVCKMCWITMDPFTSSRGSKRKIQNQMEGKNTRLCTVFLKDVLGPASSKKDSTPKFEKEEQEDEIFVISDDSSIYEEETNRRPKRNLRNQRANKSSGESDTNSRQGLKRGLKQETQRDDTANKKLSRMKNETTIVPSTPRRSTRYQSSDSDSVKGKSKQSNASKIKTDTMKRAKSLPKVDDDRLEEKLSEVKESKNDRKRKGVNAKTVESKGEDSAGSGSGETGQKLRKVRNKVPLILKPKLPESQKSKKNLKSDETQTAVPPQSKSPTVSKNSSIQSLAKSPDSKIKLSPKRSKTLMMVSFPFKLKDPYECKVCKTAYRNKIVGMKHELTHFKQVEIKIEKLNINHHFQTNDQNSTTSPLPDATGSPELTSTNEISTQEEIPTSTTPPKTDYDQSSAPDHQTEAEEGKSIRRSEKSQSIEQEDQIADIDNAKETEPVSSSNDLPLEQESISATNAESAENVVVSELPAETDIALEKVDDTSPEADSMTETNVNDLDETVKLFEESVDDDNKEKEEVEELEKTIDIIEEKQATEDKSNDEKDSPSLEITATKNVEKDRDSGKELESDIDISIMDTGSSAEDSRGQTEKCGIDNTKIAENDSDEKLMEEKPTETKEDSKLNGDESKDTLNDEPDANISSTINLDEIPDVESKSNGLSSQVEKENEKECEIIDVNEKLGEDVRPPSSVTEVSQEVIDLATAEVKKRIESEESSVAETLENISEEINKTTQGSPAVDEILANIDTAMSKETEPSEIDSNPTQNLSKNHLEENNVHD